ncbi:hypothetical protein GCM10009623_06430 [Nocardioides aestuarii]
MALARSAPTNGAGRSFAGAASAAVRVRGANPRLTAPSTAPAAVTARPRRGARGVDEIVDMDVSRDSSVGVPAVAECSGR